ncbi:MAG: PilZ domain-containing protein [Pseudomonadota bacterium]
MNDRRRNPRYECYLAVMCDQCVPGTISKDISLNGMFIQIDPVLYKQGDELTLTLNIPTRPTPFDVKCRVTRLTGDGIGVEFIHLTAFDQEILNDCLDFFKDVLPLQ